MVTANQPGEPSASLLVEHWAKQTFAKKRRKRAGGGRWFILLSSKDHNLDWRSRWKRTRIKREELKEVDVKLDPLLLFAKVTCIGKSIRVQTQICDALHNVNSFHCTECELIKIPTAFPGPVELSLGPPPPSDHRRPEPLDHRGSSWKWKQLPPPQESNVT